MTTIEKPRIRVFTKEELEAIVGATENDQEQAMVAFMLDCGPRTGETAAMRLEDVRAPARQDWAADGARVT